MRDEQAVPKELAEQLDIGSLAAPWAGSGEFKQGLEQLNVLDLRWRNAIAAKFRNRKEKIPVSSLVFKQRSLSSHVNRPVIHLGFAIDRAGFDAEAATGAIFWSHLKCIAKGVELTPAWCCRFERGRCRAQQLTVVNLRANDGVRTNQNALAALNA